MRRVYLLLFVQILNEPVSCQYKFRIQAVDVFVFMEVLLDSGLVR